MNKVDFKNKLSKIWGIIKKYKIVVIIFVICIPIVLGYNYNVKQDKLREQQRIEKIQQEAIQKQREKEKAEKGQKEIENKNKKEITDIFLGFQNTYNQTRSILVEMLSDINESATQKERYDIVNNSAKNKLKEIKINLNSLNGFIVSCENNNRFKSSNFVTDKQIYNNMKDICSYLERDTRYLEKILNFILSNCDPNVIDNFDNFLAKQSSNSANMDTAFEEFLKILCTNYYDGNYIY